MRLGRQAGPIMVGPWLSEIGPELQYWIPFLRWAVSQGYLDPRRLVAISRGGVASWYRGIADGYLDILDLMPLDEFRELNRRRWAEEGGQWKQWHVSHLDQAIISRAQTHLGAVRSTVLHPSVMYRVLRPYLLGRAPLRHIQTHTHFAALVAPDVDDLLTGLPNDFVATKFYFSESFPDTAANRAFISRLVSDLARNSNVVVLDTGLQFDDHSDWSSVPTERIFSAASMMTPRDNLAVQTAVVSRARAFLGTYGGFCLLPPLCGTNAVAFYSNRLGFHTHHLDVSQPMLRDAGGGSLALVDVADREALRLKLEPLIRRGAAPPDAHVGGRP